MNHIAHPRRNPKTHDSSRRENALKPAPKVNQTPINGHLTPGSLRSECSLICAGRTIHGGVAREERRVAIAAFNSDPVEWVRGA